MERLIPNTPTHVDFTDMLCGVKDMSFIDDMKAKGYSPMELSQFVSAVSGYVSPFLSPPIAMTFFRK
mgnify:CR=1 FL=1